MKLPKPLLVLSTILFCALQFNLASSFGEEQGAVLSGTSEVEEAQRSIITVKDDAKEPPVQIIKTLSIDECIEIAVRNSLPLKMTKKSVKLAQWRVWEAMRNLLPKVGIKWSEYTGKIYGRRFFGRNQAIDIQQTVFQGGGIVYTMMQAQTNLKIVNKEYARIKNELILQVKKAYYAMAKAKENTRLQKELWGESLRINEIAIKQFESGVGANLEYLNVKSQINQINFQLTAAKGDLEIAELILKQAMNIDAKERIDIYPVEEFRKVELNYDDILADALVRRPEMQINTLMVSYYLYEVKIARSKSWPKIDLLGSFGLAKEEYIAKDAGPDPITGTDSGTDQKLEQQWYAGVKCSVPLWGSTTEYSYTKEVWVPVVASFRGTETITNSVKFNFLDNLAQFSDKYSADVDLDKARQELLKTKQDVTLEVRESCFNYEKALMQLETAVNKVKYQEGDLELSKFKRQLDEAQDSNVIDSMIKLAQEKYGYVQAISDCHMAIASISKAVGVADYFKYKEQTSKIKNSEGSKP